MSRRLDALVWFLVALGLTTSAVLSWQYAGGSGLGCAAGGGCDAVRASAFASFGPVSTPAIGVLFFSVLGAMRAWSRRPGPTRALAGLGALAALGFVAVQAFVVRAWCPWCLVVDAAAIALGPILAVVPTPGGRPQAHPALGAALGVALPVLALWLVASPPPPRARVDAPVRRGDPVTIETFVDVQCPFCRQQHARLHEVLADYEGRVRLVTRHLPLPMHPQARDAARVACCADEQGLGEVVLAELMMHDDLSSRACIDCAVSAGADPAALDACLDSVRPDARLRDDEARARARGIRRLPTCIVGGRPLEGLHDPAQLRAAIDRALTGVVPMGT